jgi:ubiquinone/menaquinone biosynthesis C-methylase UbiE
MAHRVCPVWMGYFLLSPFRRLRQNPDRILEKFLKPGMVVLDFGSAMGFFSIPMAKLVNPGGKVVCVDVQEKMLRVLQKRAKRAGVEGVIEARLSSGSGICLEEYNCGIDFVLLFSSAHEVQDQAGLFRELYGVLKPGGSLLFSEPSGHVTKAEFNDSVAVAEKSGFQQAGSVEIRSSISILLKKL